MLKQMNWIQACEQLQRQAYVLATVIGTAGSTPRCAGTKMVICAEHTYDSIGGGHLEFAVIQRARELLLSSEPQQLLEHFALGAHLAQCCGGATTVLLESFPITDLALTVFGAGHVAQALMKILPDLPLRVTWVDQRDLFPEVSARITTQVVDDPLDALPQKPIADVNPAYLVMTHDHQLDYALTEAILNLPHRWLGLIGSATKAKRFKHRLQAYDLQTLHCPVGLAAVPGKQPMEVAVSIAAELIGLYAKPSVKRAGVSWPQVKALIT